MSTATKDGWRHFVADFDITERAYTLGDRRRNGATGRSDRRGDCRCDCRRDSGRDDLSVYTLQAIVAATIDPTVAATISPCIRPISVDETVKT